MSTKVFTGNLIVTPSKKIIDRIFTNRNTKSFSQAQKSLTDQEKELTILASPEKNDKVLQFQFDCNYDTDSKKGNVSMNLQLIETDMMFEKYYLLANVENNFINAATSAGPTVKRVYFAFGMGDSLSTWAGPFESLFKGANFSLSKSGTRIINLEFIPIATSMATRNLYVEDHNEIQIFSSKIQVTAEEPISETEILNKDIVNKKYNLVIKKYIEAFLNTDPKQPQFEALILLPDIHEVITEVLKNDYDQRAYNRLFEQLGIECYVNANPKSSILNIPDIQHDGKKANLTPQVPKGQELLLTVNSIHYGNTNSIVPDPFARLNKIMVSLNNIYGIKGLKTKKFTGHFCFETNMEIKKLMKKHGIIKDYDKNIFIFGDIDLINELIYVSNTENSGSLGKVDILNVISVPPEVRKNIVNKIIYRKEIFEYSNKLLELSYDYGSSKISDSLSLNNVVATKKFKPIFKYNVENPNVISMNFEVEAGYFGALNVGLEGQFKEANVNNKDLEESENQIKDALKDAKFDKVKPLFNELANKYKTQDVSQLENVKNLLNSFNKDVELETNAQVNKSTLPQSLTNQQYATLMARVASEKYKNIEPILNKSFIEVRSKSNISIVENEIYNMLKLQTISLSIRTLPFFGFSFLQPVACKLEAEVNSIIGSRFKPKEKSFLSGDYLILGCKHVLSTTEFYSEFSLKRYLPSLQAEIDAENAKIKTSANAVKYDIK